MLPCFLLAVIIQVAVSVMFGTVFSISYIALNMIGGLIGVFMSNSLIEKINLRFC